MKNISISEQNSLRVTTEKKKNTDTKDRFTKPGLDRQMKHRIMNRFMRALRPLLTALDESLCETPVFNRLMNENTQDGFKGHYPALRTDYAKVILTKGRLPNPPALSVCSPKLGKLVFRWTDNSGIQESLPSDLLFIGVYNRETCRWIFKVDAADRSARRYTMDATVFQEKPVQVYAGFISADSGRISTSLFLGEVRVF